MLRRRFVIGDIHGRIEALKEVLKKAEFNYKKDKLIILGDVVDGGYNTYEVVEELLKIKDKTFIMGNHDEWFINHIKTGWAEEIWLQQGGDNTLRSYGAKVITADYISDESKINTNKIKIPVTHQEFFNSAIFYLEMDKMLFVHGGFNIKKGLKKSTKHELLWDRGLIAIAVAKNKNKYPEFMKKHIHRMHKYYKIFVGHTTTQTYGCMRPTKFENIIMMDCGAGWTGRLALLDIDTNRFWLSKKQDPARGTESENLKRMLAESLKER